MLLVVVVCCVGAVALACAEVLVCGCSVFAAAILCVIDCAVQCCVAVLVALG